MANQEELIPASRTLDWSTGEEALKLAARLQHEHRQRVSLGELKEMAISAEIAPEFVDQALLLMYDRQEPLPMPKVEPKPLANKNRRLYELGALPFVIMIQMFTTSLPYVFSRDAPIVLFSWVLWFALYGIAGYFMPSFRRAVGLGIATMIGLILLGSYAVFSESYTLLWVTLGVEATAFLGGQFLRNYLSARQEDQVEARGVLHRSTG
jgi:hypothetical protein